MNESVCSPFIFKTQLHERKNMHNIYKTSKTYLLLIALGISHTLPAEVVLDGTLGPSGPLAGSNFAIEAELGQQMGNNLFHSFERFNLNTGEMATFSGPNSIQNIISRVTGGNRSEIDGTIRYHCAGYDETH